MPQVFQLISMVSFPWKNRQVCLDLHLCIVTYLNSGGQVGDVLKAVVKCDKCEKCTL
jgi:hypothetical protein